MWAGWAAAGWAFAFAAISVYWAAGGTIGLASVGGTIEQRARARDPVIVAIVVLTGGLKVIAGLIALGLVVQPLWLPLRLLRRVAWLAGGAMIVYGAVQTVGHGLMATHVIPRPSLVSRSAIFWHLVVWNPFWMLGGLLFAVTARQSATFCRGSPSRRGLASSARTA